MDAMRSRTVARSAGLALTLALAGCSSEEATPPAAPAPSQQAPSEPAVGTVELFVDLPAPSEGITLGVDPQGKPALYIGDKTAVHRIAPDKTITKVADIPNPLGMAPLAGGAGIVICAKAPGDAGKGDHPGAIWKLTPDGQASVVVASSAEVPIDQPNMIAVGPTGELVFSDSKASKVFRVDPGAATPTLLTDAITYPNGVAFTADRKKLLVASYNGKKIWSLARDDAGTYGAPEVFHDGPESVDGITPLASGGYVLVQSGEGIVRYDTAFNATPLGLAKTPNFPSNGAFGAGEFGDRWIYVAHLLGKFVKRVYVGEPGAPL